MLVEVGCKATAKRDPSMVHCERSASPHKIMLTFNSPINVR